MVAIPLFSQLKDAALEGGTSSWPPKRSEKAIDPVSDPADALLSLPQALMQRQAARASASSNAREREPPA